MGVPITVYLCMYESSVLTASRGNAGIQRLLGWRPHRSVLRLVNAEDQTDASWCWGVPGVRAVSDRLSWRWLIRVIQSAQVLQRGALSAFRQYGVLRGGDRGSTFHYL